MRDTENNGSFKITADGVYSSGKKPGNKRRKQSGVLVGLAVAACGGVILFLIISGEARCEVTGGDWRTFNSGCINSCPIESGKKNRGVQCFAEETQSCRCKRGDCWNGKFCEKIDFKAKQ